MPQEVVFYHSGMAGAPTAALNSLGALVAVLDACLVDGFNSIAVSTITQSAGIATVTTAGSHNFSAGDRTVDISGADQAAYNGRHTVLSTPAANQFTFAVDAGTVSPATGAMTAKHGPAGWAKQTPAANVRVYTTSSPSSAGHAVQIEDNNPNADSNVTYRARMVHNWTALNTGDQLAPSALATKYSASGFSATWFVAADGKTVYMGIGRHFNLCFGEAATIVPGDVFAFYLSRGQGTGGTNGGTPSKYAGDLLPVGWPNADPPALNTVPAYFLRSYTNAGAEVYCMAASMQPSVMGGSGASGVEVLAMDFVSPATLAAAGVPLFATPCYAIQGTSAADTRVVRGTMRGLYRLAGGLVAGGEFTGPSASFVLLPSVQLGLGAPRPAVLCRTFAGTATNAEQQFLLDLGPTWDL